MCRHAPGKEQAPASLARHHVSWPCGSAMQPVTRVARSVRVAGAGTHVSLIDHCGRGQKPTVSAAHARSERSFSHMFHEPADDTMKSRGEETKAIVCLPFAGKQL